MIDTSTAATPRKKFGLALEQFMRSPSFFVMASLVLFGVVFWMGVTATVPFAHDVTADQKGDDWWVYDRNARNIVDEGLLLNAVPGAYYAPGAFLYNYYVAAIYAVAGAQSGYVYASHYLMVAFAALFTWLLARRYVPPLPALALMVITAANYLTSMIDWMHRLLSENVVIAVCPLMLYLIVVGLQKRSATALLASGVACGSLVLLRSNLIAIPILIGAVLALAGSVTTRERLIRLVWFGGGAAGAFSLLPIRNYVASGDLFATGAYGTLLPNGDASRYAAMIGRKMLMNFGVAVGGFDLSGTELLINKRLVALNLLAAFAIAALVYLRRLETIDLLCVAVIVAAYVPFALLPALGAYGFRFQAPYAPLLLLPIFRAILVVYQRAMGRAADRHALAASPEAG